MEKVIETLNLKYKYKKYSYDIFVRELNKDGTIKRVLTENETTDLLISELILCLMDADKELSQGSKK